MFVIISNETIMREGKYNLKYLSKYDRSIELIFSKTQIYIMLFARQTQLVIIIRDFSRLGPSSFVL